MSKRIQPLAGTSTANSVWQQVIHYAANTTLPDYLKNDMRSAQPVFLIEDTPDLDASALSHLNPLYLEASTQYLKQKSSLIDRVAVQLSQQLVEVYRTKITDQKTAAKKKGDDSSLPFFEVIPETQSSTRVETNLNGEMLLSTVRRLIEDVFEKNGFWEKGATEIWSNLVLWAIEEIKLATGEVDLADCDPDWLNHRVYQFLLNGEATIVQQRLIFLEEFYSQTITRHITEDLNLSDYPLTGLEVLLGIKTETGKKSAPVSEVQLSHLDTVAAIPTGLPIVSSISAQLQSDLWQSDGSGVAHFRYRSKNNLNNYLEHYITSPGDIEALPWEAAEQIINKFGFNTVKLQFIFAAYAMRQARPWESTFTLKATDIIEELGWDKNHNTNLSTKRNELASIAYALSCLLIKAVWIEGKGKNQVDASTPIGRMWEVLIDPHGQFDWTTGSIDAPDEVFITVRPGLWTAHFLNQAGSKAKEALYQFGYLALNILKLDPYHDELTLRLAIHLTLDVRIRARDRNPHEYKVRSLLEAVLPGATLLEARQSSEKARSLFSRWNRALKLLADLGWQPAEAKPQQENEPVFYLKPYPEWLIASMKLKKPRGWVEEWLEQKLVIKPPDPIPGRMASLTGSKTARKQLKAESATPLTGELIKAARKQKGWTQTKLAGVLAVHQSLIAKIESGDRPISTQMEASLRQALGI
jgi:DNA-binding XRE family transcriptional regulator